MHGVVLQEQFKGGRVQRQPFLDTQPAAQTASGDVTNHAFNRNHIQLLDQRFRAGKQALKVRGNAGRFQFFHDEGIKAVVHHALAVELLFLLAVKSRRIVAKDHHKPVGVVGTVYGFGLARVKLFTLFHVRSPDVPARCRHCLH